MHDQMLGDVIGERDGRGRVRDHVALRERVQVELQEGGLGRCAGTFCRPEVGFIVAGLYVRQLSGGGDVAG